MGNFIAKLRDSYGPSAAPIFIGGLIGSRGDAYTPKEALASAEAEQFHTPQLEALAEAQVDFLYAATLPALTEAEGIARAMAKIGLPYLLCFIIRRDGTLLDGTLLAQAIETIDGTTPKPPTGYAINCVYPTVFSEGLAVLENHSLSLSSRILSFQANTSAKDPQELDGLSELETEKPEKLAELMVDAYQQFHTPFSVVAVVQTPVTLNVWPVRIKRFATKLAQKSVERLMLLQFRREEREIQKMVYKKLFPQVIIMALVILLIARCGADTPTPEPPTSTPIPPTITPEPTPSPVPTVTPTPESLELWEDATEATIGTTEDWTNRVELADINSDGLVDLLFANGGNFNNPAYKPAFSQAFLNQGAGERFREVGQEVFGPEGMLARVIKVHDINGDRQPDILVGTTWQSQSRLYLGDGSGDFTEVTETHLPRVSASVGDLELGDVDSDGDLDVVLADWGPENPEFNEGGRIRLWLNDGLGHFSDATDDRMPDVLVKWSWELEFVDVDNDYSLDILVSCKMCTGGYLFENDGTGTFADKTAGNLPQFGNNYDFEAMDLNGDGYLDLTTINDGLGKRENLFLNNQQGGFEDATAQLWPDAENLGKDDGVVVFLDYESDGDADFLIGSLDGPDRLMINDGRGRLKLAQNVFVEGKPTYGTLGLALADLNGDGRLDVVEAQGEAATMDERVFLGMNIQPDTAPPVITMIEQVEVTEPGQPIQVRARIHDNKSPTMPHDWQSVLLRWSTNDQTQESPMEWYGEYLWRGTIDDPPAGDVSYQVCATDAAGNEACSLP